MSTHIMKPNFRYDKYIFITMYCYTISFTKYFTRYSYRIRTSLFRFFVTVPCRASRSLLINLSLSLSLSQVSCGCMHPGLGLGISSGFMVDGLGTSSMKPLKANCGCMHPGAHVHAKASIIADAPCRGFRFSLRVTFGV